MSAQIKDYATALDALAFTCLHGDRPQQIESAIAARGMLLVAGYQSRPAVMRSFDVSVRHADGGVERWTCIAHSSIDATLHALERFEGQQVAITVKAEGRA